jgi:FKBP-type peptidyl-prolyl cis-trans isomerase FkpA
MSEVTAVPIRPLPKGSVLKLWAVLAILVALAAGLAWWTTGQYREVVLPSGVRYRVIQQGTGPAITPADAFAVRYKLHANSRGNPVLQDSDSTGQPFVGTVGAVYPGFGEGLQHMQAGGRYLLSLPPGTHVTSAPPPEAGFTPGDTLVFEIQVLQIAPGQAQAFEAQQMQRLQQQLQAQMEAQGGGAPGQGAPGQTAPSGGGRPRR